MLYIFISNFFFAIFYFSSGGTIIKKRNRLSYQPSNVIDFYSYCQNPTHLKRVFHNFYTIKSLAEQTDNTDVLLLIYCLEEAIDDAFLTDRQRVRLYYWMQGYSDKAIAKIEHVSSRTVRQCVYQACRTISYYVKEGWNWS